MSYVQSDDDVEAVLRWVTDPFKNPRPDAAFARMLRYKAARELLQHSTSASGREPGRLVSLSGDSMLTTKEAAERLGVTTRTIRRRAARSADCLRDGRDWRISLADIE